MQNKSLFYFIFAVLLWLPVCFTLWFLSAPAHSSLVRFALSLFPDFHNIKQVGYFVEIVPLFSPHSNISLQLTVNPLLYGYGMPFLAALCFSSSGNWEKRLEVFFIGYLVVLLPIQIFGSWVSLWKTLVFDFNAPINFPLEILALAYQLSSLILPAMTPLMIWGWGFQNDLYPHTREK
jgi:hypothetical protein